MQFPKKKNKKKKNEYTANAAEKKLSGEIKSVFHYPGSAFKFSKIPEQAFAHQKYHARPKGEKKNFMAQKIIYTPPSPLQKNHGLSPKVISIDSPASRKQRR